MKGSRNERRDCRDHAAAGAVRAPLPEVADKCVALGRGRQVKGDHCACAGGSGAGPLSTARSSPDGTSR